MRRRRPSSRTFSAILVPSVPLQQSRTLRRPRLVLRCIILSMRRTHCRHWRTTRRRMLSLEATSGRRSVGCFGLGPPSALRRVGPKRGGEIWSRIDDQRSALSGSIHGPLNTPQTKMALPGHPRLSPGRRSNQQRGQKLLAESGPTGWMSAGDVAAASAAVHRQGEPCEPPYFLRDPMGRSW